MTSQSLKNFPISLAAVTAMIAATPAFAQTNTSSLSHEVVLSDLDAPWDMAFLDDGTMFFTEKCHGLSVRMPDGAVNALLGVGDTEGYASNAEDLFCEGRRA